MGLKSINGQFITEARAAGYLVCTAKGEGVHGKWVVPYVRIRAASALVQFIRLTTIDIRWEISGDEYRVYPATDLG